MRNAADGMGEAFNEWRDLTDAYERQLHALMRHEPGAAEALSQLSKHLERAASEYREGGVDRHSGEEGERSRFGFDH